MEQSVHDAKDVCDVRNIYVPQNIIVVFQVRFTHRKVASRSTSQLVTPHVTN